MGRFLGLGFLQSLSGETSVVVVEGKAGSKEVEESCGNVKFMYGFRVANMEGRTGGRW